MATTADQRANVDTMELPPTSRDVANHMSVVNQVSNIKIIKILNWLSVNLEIISSIDNIG
jgi:hypothetical protein